tara:strand:+ start:176 stop:664 length:489 start_codon:yes stop_codon:yes gene_type:complete
MFIDRRIAYFAGNYEIKCYTMKNLLLAVMLIACTTAYSQNFSVESYEPVFQDDLVKVSVGEGIYTEESRNLSHSRYFIQYENLTNEDIEVTLLKELHYGDRCYGCNDNEESYKTVVIPANATLSYSADNNDKRFYFFIKDNNGLIKSQLTDFIIKIVKTTKL